MAPYQSQTDGFPSSWNVRKKETSTSFKLLLPWLLFLNTVLESINKCNERRKEMRWKLSINKLVFENYMTIHLENHRYLNYTINCYNLHPYNFQKLKELIIPSVHKAMDKYNPFYVVGESIKFLKTIIG